jgi:hypothetical protein
MGVSEDVLYGVLGVMRSDGSRGAPPVEATFRALDQELEYWVTVEEHFFLHYMA